MFQEFGHGRQQARIRDPTASKETTQYRYLVSSPRGRALDTISVSLRVTPNGQAAQAGCHCLIARQRLIPIRFHIGNLMLAAGWKSPSLRTTQSRLITSLRRPPALRSYSFECEFV
jgi:hypothetical protein